MPYQVQKFPKEDILRLQIGSKVVGSKMTLRLEDDDGFSTDMATESTIALSTPTDTVIMDDDPLDKPSSRDAVPWPGDTFIIRDRAEGRVLTIRDSHVELESVAKDYGGHHWVCTDRNGWLGFKNKVSGKHLGWDGDSGFVAIVDWLKGWESFMAKKHPEGGYLLLVNHRPPFARDRWVAMAAKPYSDKVIKMELGEAVTRWEFQKVEG